jgi:hypothetical protein
MRTIIVALFTGTLLLGAPDIFAEIARSMASEGAKASILSPADGAVVATTFTVQFGLKGMGIAPAGYNIQGTGHHHLLVDNDAVPDSNLPLPASNQVIHFGLGQTEAQLTLSPGKHTLQLILGDYLHIPHEPPVRSEKITITVAQ